MLLNLHFKVLYRRLLFSMSIIYYFGDHNRAIPRATANKLIKFLICESSRLSDEGGVCSSAEYLLYWSIARLSRGQSLLHCILWFIVF